MHKTDDDDTKNYLNDLCMEQVPERSGLPFRRSRNRRAIVNVSRRCEVGRQLDSEEFLDLLKGRAILGGLYFLET